MDPNKALAVMRAAVAGWDETGGEDMDYGDDMSVAFAALDQWLSKGGFWPSDWNPSGGSTCGRCADADESVPREGYRWNQ